MVTISLLLVIQTNPVNGDDSVSTDTLKCFPERNYSGQVSLGHPFSSNRLIAIGTNNILVIPFSFLGEKIDSITQNQKNVFYAASNRINELSNGKSRINFIFAQNFSSNIEKSNVWSTIQNRDTSNPENNPIKYARQLVRDVDTNIDFTDIQGVIFIGSNTNPEISWTLSFMFSNDVIGEPNKPVITDEGVISNLIFTDGFSGLASYTLVHELMHNYGLVDLYKFDPIKSSSVNTPNFFSLMARERASSRLLLYEKALLRWNDKLFVVCEDISNSKPDYISNKKLSLDLSNESIFVLKTSAKKAYVIEIFPFRKHNYIIAYTIDNDVGNPPINLSWNIRTDGEQILYGDLSSPSTIGSIFKFTEFELLIINLTAKKVDLNFLSPMMSAEEVNKLKTEALKNFNQSIKRKISPKCFKEGSEKKLPNLKGKCPKGYKKV